MTLQVVIAGGGVAGLEALVALRSLAGDHVAVTLVAPDEHFTLRALSVAEPFARPEARRYPLAELCAAHGATLRRDTVAAVDPAARTVALGSGEALDYDALVVATGARPEPAYERVTTFRGAQDAEALHGLVQDLEGGWSRSVAFVVPPGITWPLPLYELALMAAERAASLSLAPSIVLVTPEERPLGLFGGRASAAVDAALRRAGIALVASAHVAEVDHGRLLGPSGRLVAQAERVVALPLLAAVPVPGLPVDPQGFVPVDDHGHVLGLDGVFAAGDGTSFPVKQGGIAAQMADAAARAIAERAGARVRAEPFRPELRAELLTGTRSLYLREALAGGAGDGSSQAADHRLWWPPTKVAAPYLAPALERLAAPA